MTHLVPITWLSDNPYQPRQSTTPESVQRLADSITANGLMQAPIARVVLPDGTIADEATLDLTRILLTSPTETQLSPGWRIQIAFGHTRLKAFRLLAKDDPAFARMPVTLAVLTDHQMFVMAYEENENRSSLNAIEQAEAMSRAEKEFGWTHAEIAERMKLERSTVSNTIRLTRLPDAVKKQIKAGTMSKRNALALVQLADIPEALLEVARKSGAYNPDQLYKQAATMKPDDIRAQIGLMLRYNAKPLAGEGEFEQNHFFAGAEIVSPFCTSCDHRIALGKQHFCPLAACWEAKKAQHKAEALQRASEITGMSAHTGGGVGFHVNTFGGGERGVGAVNAALTKGCTNLHVVNSTYGAKPVDGCAGCVIACVKTVSMGSSCRCAADYEREHQTTEEKHRLALREAVAQTIQPAVDAIAEALKQHNPALLKHLISMVGYQTYGGSDDTDSLLQALAKTVINHVAQRGTAPGVSLQSVVGAEAMVIYLAEKFALPIAYDPDLSPTFVLLVNQISGIERTVEMWQPRPGQRAAKPTSSTVLQQSIVLAGIKRQLIALTRLDDVAGRIAALESIFTALHVFANTSAEVAA